MTDLVGIISGENGLQLHFISFCRLPCLFEIYFPNIIISISAVNFVFIVYQNNSFWYRRRYQEKDKRDNVLAIALHPIYQ